MDRRQHLCGAASAAYLLATTPGITLLGDNLELVGRLGAGYAFLLATSGWVVRGALWFAGVDRNESQADTGRAVGKIENVLILTLALVGAYTALAVAFAAKSIVRWQDVTSENTTYYLTGSITNVTYSVAYGLAAAWVLHLPIG